MAVKAIKMDEKLIIIFFKIYVKGFPGAAELRNQLMSTKSTDEVRALLDKFEASVNVVEGSETV